MKATGIVRRIDDLGRVVIPKEIRRTMRLREGDPLEIYVGDGGVCFKKYNVAESIMDDFIHFKENVEENIYDMSIPAEKRTEIFETLKVLLELLKEEREDDRV